MRIQVLQNTAVITSTLKVEDIKTLQEVNRKALAVLDEEQNEIFSVSYHEGKGNISKYGITFDTVNADGLAVIATTIVIKDGQDIKKVIARDLREALHFLPKVEAQINVAISELNEEIDNIASSIEILG